MTCRHGSPPDKCRICLLEKEVESLKAITELAVKTMTEIATEHFGSANSYSWQQSIKTTLSEIEGEKNK